MLLALFAVAPIICSCLCSLLYSLYLFMAYEESGVHHAQEFENRFWTIFAMLLSTALFFAKDSPLAFGLWSPSLGFFSVLVCGYAMHLWDRYLHRLAISQSGGMHLRRSATTDRSLLRLQDLGIPVEQQLAKINQCLTEIDQLLIPSTINNLINQRYVLTKEQEIISIFEECDARALNYLISHVKLGLLFYKIKDHRNFNGKNRTDLINLLAVERLSILTVVSRVILLHSLQLLKLRANPKAEFWVQNIILNTHQDALSELKTLTDAKGDYFSMNKLIYDDIRSESVRHSILTHFRREAAVQQTHMQMGTGRRQRMQQWRKVLSDVDDTLCSSGGTYPAGIDKRYSKKTVYPGVLAFYRELDLGIEGPDEWQDGQVGNLVFLSARPHIYRDMSEKHNFAKFEKLRADTLDGRKGMHTVPSLLAGDLASGSQFVMKNDMEPLARKKFDNFRRYVSIYPEYKHVFIGDNGQGDVKAGEMMFDNYPYELEAVYVHVVRDVKLTYGYDLSRWREKEFKPCFFRCYPEAALHAATQTPPLIRLKGLQRICQDAGKDFLHLKNSQFASDLAREDRRIELNQAIWKANDFLVWHLEEPVEMIPAEQIWNEGEKVKTPYGIGEIRNFDPIYNMYDVYLDWRPLDIQLQEYEEERKRAAVQPRKTGNPARSSAMLPTVVELDEEETTTLTNSDSGVFQSAEEGRANIVQEVGQSSAEIAEKRTHKSYSRDIDNVEIARTPPRRKTALHEPPVLVSDVNDVPDETEAPESMGSASNIGKSRDDRSRIRAQISGRVISKYTPPKLPIIDSKKKPSRFLFLTKSPLDSSKKLFFKKGDEVITPYGLATVIEQRLDTDVVVVDMVGWRGTAYLQENVVKHVSKSLFGSILRQISGVDDPEKALEFPYAMGTKISTPYGMARVTRPLLPPAKSSKKIPATTIGLSLEGWTLANGTHPMLYCTVKTAQFWKEQKTIGKSSLFSSTLGSLVSSSRTLLEPFLSQKIKNPVKEKPKLFKRYYQDAAAVTTSYGNGRVLSFRETDGFYEVQLTDWTMGKGRHPTMYVREDDISHRIAKGCHEGYPVLTSLGISGTLASIEPTTGVHLVTAPSAGIVCYLQPEAIVCPLKACVHEEVLTPYGEGKVLGYEVNRDMYTIGLNWGATLYAKSNAFDRIVDGVQDHVGSFGIEWLLRFLFFRSSSNEAPGGGRSRSNSVVSGTHSTRSGA